MPFAPHLAYALVVAAMLALPAAPTVPAARSAVNQFHQLQNDLREAHAQKNWPAYLKDARALKALLHDSPESVLQLMSAQAASGDIPGALDSFRDYIRMGQASEETLKLQAFDALRADPQFPDLHRRMIGNATAVSIAGRAFSLNDTGLIPEDIDYDPRTSLFYITSVLKQQIFTSDKNGNLRTFADSPDHWPVLAIKLDRQHNTLWATEVAFDGMVLAPQKDWGRSAVLVYDLKSRRLLRRIEGPAHTALGDMALTPEGDAILSDGDGGGIYRIRRDSQQIERIDAGDFISPQTAAVLPDGRHIFVPDYVRGVAMMDLDSRRVTWLESEGAYALSGIDGLYLKGDTLIATQNGTSPERVIAFHLDAARTRILKETVIERATATLGDPTHGVVIGNSFFYIANSGWNTLDDHGRRKPEVQASAAGMMRAKIPQG